MDLTRSIAQLKGNARAIQALTEDLAPDGARWTPEEDAWSILDVINHLAYEETYDFRARLDLVLHHPQEAWVSSDSSRGVTESSRQRELGASLASFLAARDDSVAWLKALEMPQWETTHEAPFGRIRAGDIMAAWVAHDLLHLRQIIELRWAYLAQEAAPYGLRYAGTW